MSYIYKSSGNERVIFELSRNDKYVVELIQGDNGKQLVRKKLIDLKQKEQFINKAMVLFNISQAEGDNIGFVKILFIDTIECCYIMEYISGPILTNIIEQIDIIKDAEDLDNLRDELSKLIERLNQYDKCIFDVQPDQFLLSSNGELIWYNYIKAFDIDCNSEQKLSAVEIAQRFIDDIKEPKLEALRIAQEGAKIEQEKQELYQKKLREQKEREQEMADEAERKKTRGLVIFVSTFVLILSLSYLFFATPFVNFIKAKLTYDNIVKLNDSYRISSKDNNLGLLNENYNILLDAEYQSIDPLSSGDIYVSKDGKYGLYSKSIDEIYPIKYDSITLYLSGYAILHLDGKSGLSIKGKDVSDISYDKIDINGDSFLLYRGENHIVYSQNREAFIYQNADYIPFKQNGLYGYNNPVGDMLIEPMYKTAKSFKYGGAIVSLIKDKAERYGLINFNNEKVLDITYEAIVDFNPVSAIIKRDGQYGVVDMNTKNEFIYGYTWISRSDDKYKVYKGDKSMIMNGNGKFEYTSTDLIPHKFNNYSSDPWGYIDIFGNTVVSPQYCSATKFSEEGFAKVEVSGFFWNDHYTLNLKGERLKKR